MRLQSYLSQSGVASRRGVVGALEAGKVKVNGEVVRIPSYPIFPEKDTVTYEDTDVKLIQTKNYYYLFHKPKGVISTAKDTHGRKTVLDFFKDMPGRLFTVGRLDQDTTGLLLVTNDGGLTNRLTHPRFGVEKVYEVIADRIITEDERKQLSEGVMVEERKTSPCQVEILGEEGGKSKVQMTLHEGRKRQIRNMFEVLGSKVVELHRKRYGKLELGDLKPSEMRELSEDEVSALQESIKDVPGDFKPRGDGPRGGRSGGNYRGRGGKSRGGKGRGSRGGRGRSQGSRGPQKSADAVSKPTESKPAESAS